MSYTRTEYRSDADRQHDDDKQGGWRSWFGLGGNKDEHNDRDRGYSYTNTTTYRGDDNNRYGFSGDRTTGGYSGAVSGGYSGSRGGYGYTTSDDAYRGGNQGYSRNYDNTSNWNRDSTSRGGDRDTYYRQETRTYPTTGYSGSSNYTTGTTGGNYGSSYGPSSYGNDRDYSVSRTTTSYNNDRDSYRPSGNTSYGFSGDRDTNTYRNTSYNTSGDRDNFNRGSYSSGYATSGNQGGFSGPGNYSSSYTSPSGTYGQSSNYSYNRSY